jgi:hypothetical protein
MVTSTSSRLTKVAANTTRHFREVRDFGPRRLRSDPSMQIPHEFRFGEWQDALLAILLCDVRSADRSKLPARSWDASATVERASLIIWPRRFIVLTTRLSTQAGPHRDASSQSRRRLACSWQSAYSICHELGCGRRSVAQKTLGRRTERGADRASSRI